jgi:membrane associated rhomboid family serine protease
MGSQEEKANGITLGFSGVNAAFLMIFAALRPYARLNILGSSSTAMPVKIALRRMMLIDIVGFVLELTTEFNSPLAHGGHLGGYFAGAVANFFLLRKGKLPGV